MKKSYYYILFFLLFCINSGYSQSHVYKHYGVEDGLPSSEVYSAFQDSKGYMWFATDAGVSRFNGYEFENFDATDGLTDNTVFLITEDSKGRIWFGTFNLKLCYYQNDSIYPFKYNDEIQSGIKGKGALQSFAIDANDNIWMGFLIEGLYKVSSTGEVNQMIDIPKGSHFNLQYCKKNDMEVFGVAFNYELAISSYKLNTLKEGRITKGEYKIIYNNSIYKDTLTTRRFVPGEYSTHLFKFEKSYLIQFYNEWLLCEVINGRMRQKRLKSNFPNESVLSGIVDNDYLWVCLRGDGVFQCKIKGDSLVVVNHFLEGADVSRVLKGDRGGYWLMTLNKGVYYLSSKEIKYIEVEENNTMLCLEVDTISGDLFSGLSKGKVVKLMSDKLRLYFKEVVHIPKLYHSLLYDYSNKSLILGSSDVLDSLPVLKEGKLSYRTNYGRGGYKSMMIEEGKLYGAGSFGVSVLGENNEKYASYLASEEKIWCTSVIKYQGKIWVGANEGIRILSNQKLLNPFSKDPYLSSAITSMAKLSSDILLLGTKSFGVLVVENEKVVARLSKKEGLTSNLVKAIHVDNENVVWVGTKIGLNRVDFLSVTNFKISKLTKKNGLISGDISAIRSHKNKLYLATTSGLAQFDKTKIKENRRPPLVYITQFRVNSSNREVKENTKLSYKENFIKIYFEGLNYRSLGEVEYLYRMLGVDSNWVSTTARSVQYPTLQPKKYAFEVKAKNEDGYWSKTEVISFTITPPFWLTWWFVSIEISFGIGIVSGIFWYREKQNRIKSDAEKKMIELELKALRSQINPHFIFNTLNSIQHYIAINDFKNSNKYIVQFATLIRKILHVSEKNVITIQEEVEILSMYMDLEKMRFEEQFDYNIEVANSLDKDYDEIPSMLLQPYVENAIWHGLMNKKGKGRIKIKITEEGEYICCSLEDNGIGRKAAAAIKAKRNITRKSIGMSVTQQRLDLISTNKVNVETIDLYGANGVAAGTKMLIKIQYKNLELSSYV